MTVIAMTREIGSFGMDVAAGLAARLGLEIIQSDIVATTIAERLGVDEGAVPRAGALPLCFATCRGSSACGCAHR